MIIKTQSGTRELFVTLKGKEVFAMYDASGSETFDATEAAQVQIDAGLMKLVDGDELTLRLIY